MEQKERIQVQLIINRNNELKKKRKRGRQELTLL